MSFCKVIQKILIFIFLYNRRFLIFLIIDKIFFWFFIIFTNYSFNVSSYCNAFDAINNLTSILFVFVKKSLRLHKIYIWNYCFILNIILHVFGFKFLLDLCKYKYFELDIIFVFVSLYIYLIMQFEELA
jgi:hypothetical protein